MSSDLLFEFASQLISGADRPNINGYTPHEKQLIFHSSTAKGKLFVGGNRSGKTTGGTVEAIYWLRGNHPYRSVPSPPIRARAVAVDFKDGVERILKPEFQRWIPPSLLKNGSWYDSFNSYTNTLHLVNGSFLEFMSYEQELEKFAGTSRHFVYFDEEPPKSIFSENRMRLIDTDGTWWICMTPVLGMTWMYDDIYLPGSTGEDSNILVVEVEIDENPHIDKQAIEDAFRGMDEQERQARRQGRFVQIGGMIFKNFMPHHVIEPIPIPILKQYDWYMSMDHGFNNPTAWLWHAVNAKGDVITFHEHYQREWTVERHAAFLKETLRGFGKMPEIFIGDPAIKQRNASTGLSIQIEYGMRGIPISLANNDVRAGIDRMNAYLNHRKWHITENCVNLIKEMRRYRWKTYTSAKLRDENNLREEPHKKDDHAVDAARYFFTFMPDLTTDPPSKYDHVRDVEAAIGPGTPVFSDFQTDPGFRSFSAEVPVESDFSPVDDYLGNMY